MATGVFRAQRSPPFGKPQIQERFVIGRQTWVKSPVGADPKPDGRGLPHQAFGFSPVSHLQPVREWPRVMGTRRHRRAFDAVLGQAARR